MGRRDEGDAARLAGTGERGRQVSVHATYDTSRADWYEVMGIMPVAVYHGTLSGFQDAQDPACPTPNTHPPPPDCIPEDGVQTHEHLAENDNHGGESTGAADPFSLPSAPSPGNTVNIQSFAYHAGNAGLSVPTIQPGQSLTFHNNDAIPASTPSTRSLPARTPVRAGPASPIRSRTGR